MMISGLCTQTRFCYMNCMYYYYTKAFGADNVYTYVTITLCSISSLSVLALVLSAWQWCLGGSAWPSQVLCLAGSPSTLPALSFVLCPLRQYKEEFLCFCWAGKDNRAMSWSSLHPWVGESLMECGWLSQLVSCSIYSRIDRLLVCRCVSVSNTCSVHLQSVSTALTHQTYCNSHSM